MSYDVNKAFLASNSYGFGQSNIGQTITGPNGNRWMVFDASRETSTGYQGVLLKNLDTGGYELVSRGTEFDREPIKDGIADLQMGFGQLPDQVADARAFLKESLNKILRDGGNPTSDLNLTGHSLGGSITQVLGAENPLLRATAFNPYGTGNLIPEGNYPNITNHIASSDTVSTLPGSNMVGETLRYESPGGHSIAQFVNTSLATQSGVHVNINMPPVQGVDTDPMGTGDGAAIMNAVRVETPLNTNSDPTTDYNFADTAGAGRGIVNPDAVRPPATVFNPATALPSYSGNNAVTVQPGDTVSNIAKRYDMTVQQFSSYLKEQYGDSADLNSIVAGHKLPIPQDVFQRTLGGLNGLDLAPENPILTPRAQEINDALVDAFSNPQVPAGKGTLIADNSATLPQEADVQNVDIDSSDIYQSVGLFNGLSNLQNWDELSDVGKLSAMLGFYNAIDGLGAAFDGTGNNLPGDFAELSGWLNFVQGLQRGDVFTIANGINQVSDQVVDEALNSMLGSSEVPYVSALVAFNNLEDNPAQSLGALAGMHVAGPLGGAIGWFIGGAFGGLFGDDDIPMRQGLAHAQWDAQGQIQIITTQDAEGGGCTANSWMASLVDGLQIQLHTYNSQHNASDCLHQTLNVVSLGLARVLPNEVMPINSLIDVDGDDYLEKTQWVQANQAILSVDLNRDGQISLGETVNLQHTRQVQQARTSLAWLDANQDARLTAQDPAFAAIRLWIDVDADGKGSPETRLAFVPAGQNSAQTEVRLVTQDMIESAGTVADQYGLSTKGSTTLVIAAVNDAPVTQGKTAQTQEDTASSDANQIAKNDGLFRSAA